MKSPNDYMNVGSWTVIAVILSAILLTSMLVPIDAAPGKAQSKKLRLDVHTHAINGDILSAYVVIKSDNTIVKSGFAPLKYTGNAGSYTIEVQNYSDWIFDKWDDGSTSNPRTITLELATTAIAYFGTVTVPVGEEEVPGDTDDTTSDQTTDDTMNDLTNINADCIDILVPGVSASGDDGNVPENTLDNDLSTRWSDLGIGSWIVLDLGQQNVICSVDVGWYKGDERISKFVISVSSDNIQYEDVFSGESGGQLLTTEKYDFVDVEGRFVKLTVNGNTQNNWASITEIDVFGIDANSEHTSQTVDEVSDQTTDDQGTEQSSDDLTSEMTDKFGVKMIYPTKSNGEQWFMNMAGATSDSRFDPKSTITQNSDGSWKIKSSKVRMNVFTSSGYDSGKITTLNQQELAKKGYMQSPNDWRNVEMTGFVKVNSTPSNDNFAWYARGGKHNDSNGGCEGTAYKGNLFYDGKVRFAKEQQHSDGYSFTSKVDATGSVIGKWVGFKTVMYNNAQGNVVLQSWINENADGVTWKKVAERVDSGGWGSDGDMCGGSPDQKITWGGPISTFRWDTASDVDFKWLSVREILVPEA